MKTQLWGSAALFSLAWALTQFSSRDLRTEPKRDANYWPIPMTRNDWHEIYNGFGANFFNETTGIILEPQASRSPQETHANLILVKKTEIHPLKDFVLTTQVATDRQLRKPKPNPWEVLWIFFNCYQGKGEPLQTNYIVIKPNGIELGQAFDRVKQKILFTRSSPQLILGKIYSITLIKFGGHIDLLIDGEPILSTASQHLHLLDTPGAIGIYSEDARAHIYGLSILPLNGVMESAQR